MALLKHFNAVTPLKPQRDRPHEPGRKPRGRGRRRAHPTHRLVQGVLKSESLGVPSLEGGLRESYTIGHHNHDWSYDIGICEVTMVPWCADNGIIA